MWTKAIATPKEKKHSIINATTQPYSTICIKTYVPFSPDVRIDISFIQDTILLTREVIDSL